MRVLAVLAVLAVLPLLAACSDMDVGDLFSFGHSDDSARPTAVATAAAAPATPAAAPGQPNNFCLGVAREDATTNGFDAATQQRVAARSYQQCVTIFGSQN